MDDKDGRPPAAFGGRTFPNALMEAPTRAAAGLWGNKTPFIFLYGGEFSFRDR